MPLNNNSDWDVVANYGRVRSSNLCRCSKGIIKKYMFQLFQDIGCLASEIEGALLFYVRSPVGIDHVSCRYEPKEIRSTPAILISWHSTINAPISFFRCYGHVKEI